MADIDTNKCLLCGKDIEDSDIFCRNCQETGRNEYPTEFHNSTEILITNETTQEDIIIIDEKKEQASSEQQDITEQEENNIPPIGNTPPKRNKKLKVFFITVIILCVSLGGAGVYFLYETKEAKEKEETYWNQCIEDNTPLAYSKYLVQYPEGIYQEDAQRKIIELRELEKKEWQDLRKTGDINALSAFLIDHPNTPYTREIRYAMDSISWTVTEKENTAAAYLAYIENVKLGNLSGEYESIAQEKYEYLSQLKTLEGEELKAITNLLDTFFKGLSAKEYKELAKMMAPTLINFFGVENKPKDVIIKSIEADIKQRKLKSINYSIQSDSPDVILDNRGLYFISLPVNREIVYNDRKKKKEEAKLLLYIELNDKKEIQTIYEKREAK